MARTDSALLDAGPIVAFFDDAEQHHAWAVEQFERLTGTAYSCEPVIAEAMFLLRARADAQQTLLRHVAAKAIVLRFDLGAEIAAVRTLHERYASVPMSLADACLVRMSEQFADLPVLTIDSDFRIYRRNRREPIPGILPPER